MCGDPGRAPDRLEHRPCLVLVEGKCGHEPVVGFAERTSGCRVSAQAGWGQAESIRAAIGGHDLSLRVPAGQERPDEVRHRRRRHPDPAREVRRGLRPLVEQDAVDRVLVGSECRIGHRVEHECSHALFRREELEQEGQARSGMSHPEILPHGSSWSRPARRARHLLRMTVGGIAARRGNGRRRGAMVRTPARERPPPTDIPLTVIARRPGPARPRERPPPTDLPLTVIARRPGPARRGSLRPRIFRRQS